MENTFRLSAGSSFRFLLTAWFFMAVLFCLAMQGGLHGLAVAQQIDFAHEVVPVLRQHCVKCHGGTEAEGGFSLNTRSLFLESKAAVAGEPAESLFLKLIASEDADLQMPPKDLPRLSEKEKAVLTRWVRQGMPWPQELTFSVRSYQAPLLPRAVELPGPVHANPIDQLVEHALRQEGSATPESISDGLFLRRASLDLTGLLPTEEQWKTFVADPSQDKRQRLVDSLLANDIAYAEHWLTFWNDLLRNDYTGTGFITGGRKQISDWLYRSLIENKPYNQFARELIAPPNNDSRGFIDGIKWRGTVSAGQTIEIQFAQSVAQSFLGINLKCASCHDSFIDQWKLSDAYSLAAVYSKRTLDIHRCDKPTGEVASPGWLFPELGKIDPDVPPAERLKQLAKLMTDDRNGRFARTIVNRMWAQLMGRGIVHPLDAMQTQPWNEDLLDYLANFLVESDYDLKAVLRLIATSNVYGARSEIVGEEVTSGGYQFAGRRAHRMTAEQFVDAVWQITGASPGKFDAPIVRGKVDREELEKVELQGEWIWGQSQSNDKQAPAGEQLIFRTELRVPSAIRSGVAVLTVDNSFDLYINRRKVASGNDWTKTQVVPLAKLLKVQQDDADPANQIVVVARNAGSGPNPAGLFFEARLVLDDGTQLSLASNADWTYSEEAMKGGREGRMGKIQGPWKKVLTMGRPKSYAAVVSDLTAGLARGKAGDLMMVRAGLVKSDFLMRSLGRPNRDQIVSSRPEELTTLEAIDLSNGETFAKALQIGAGQFASAEMSTEQLVQQIFRMALSRSPTQQELAVCGELFETPDAAGESKTEARETAVQDLLWAVFMMPEFIMVR